MSIIIGLTGPTGAGKSVVSEIAVDMGYKVINCDLMARKAVEKCTAGHSALVLTFGTEILNKDGTINRKKLAQVAFSSKENTELLNKTLLPYIVLMIKKEINCDKVLLDAPTLFESGIDSMCTATIAVLADKDIRLSRITERDNIDTESALLRISAGKSDAFYKSKANHIIYNNNDMDSFLKSFKKIISAISGNDK